MINAVSIGAGNIATTLVPVLADKIHFTQIFSRNIKNAEALAQKIGGASAIDNISQVDQDADLYLISVRDDIIAKIVSGMPRIKPHAIAAHTSGGVAMDELAPLGDNFGVFYPLQTFSKDKQVDLSNVPMFIEASNESTLSKLKWLASSISSTVYDADSELRKKLHIAGVMSSNFVNYMLVATADFLRLQGLDISVVRPLVEETITKSLSIGPELAQTGPARRGDTNLIKNHEAILDGDLLSLYSFVSDKILNRFNNEQH